MIVFDLDDTLYLERDFAFSAYRHLDKVVQTEIGITGFGATCRAFFMAGERQHIFDRACKKLGLSVDPEFIAKLIAAYRSHPPDIALCPDVVRFFARLDAPLGLISDGPAHMQRNKLTALALEDKIAHVRLTGDWPEGFGKPHPRAFEEMETYGAQRTPMIYIADNPAKDFVTPKARGWLTIQIMRPGGVHGPMPRDQAHAAAKVIETFDELEERIF